MSVTRVKVSDISVPSALVTEYSMTRTAMPGMSSGAAPLRRIGREAAGSAIRDRYVPSGRTSSTGRSTSLLARHSTCTPAPVNALSSPCERKFRSASSRSPRASRGSSLQGQRLLPGGQRRQLRPQHRPGPALAHADDPDLRERPRAGVVARIAELRAVLRPWRARPGTCRRSRQAASRRRRRSPAPPRPAARPPPPAAAASPASPAAGAPGHRRR